MGGTNDPDNLVILSAREHFIAHWILTKIYPNNRKILYALGAMATYKDKRRLSSHEFAKVREAAAKCKLGKKASPETRRRQSLARIGRVVTEETRKKLSIVSKGRIPSEEARRNMSIAQRNKKPASKETRLRMSKSLMGRKCSEETRKKLVKSHTGVKHTKETKEIISKYRKGKSFKATPILQYNLNGELIAEFSSIKEAGLQFSDKKCTQGSICRVCKGKLKTAYGYRWRYK